MIQKASIVVLAIALGACATQAGPPTLTDEQVCLHHFENDPAEQARCRLDPALRDGSPPDASPHQLPLRTGRESG